MLTDFIRTWRHQALANAPTRAFVPLKVERGEAFQFDWSEERLVIGGIWRKLMVAHLKRCVSRAFVLVAVPAYNPMKALTMRRCFWRPSSA